MGLKIATQRRSSKRASSQIMRTPSRSRGRQTSTDTLQRAIGNSATTRLLATRQIQTKLAISKPGDASEREADRVADQVLGMPESQTGLAVQRTPLNIQRACTKCEEEEIKRKPLPDDDERLLQAKHSDASAGHETGALDAYLNTSQGGGQPLPHAARAYFEPRFGRDLSQVRVHTDGKASQAATSIGARAFTAGHDIAFRQGEFGHQTHAGRRLLAHELTHVVQQSGNRNTVQRDPIEDLKKAAEELAKAELGTLANAPAGAGKSFKGDPKCGPNFCTPFVSKKFARDQLMWAGPLILAGIAAKVNTRVVPLWTVYLAGGSGPMDLSADFGADFSASTTTAKTTKFLVGELRKDIEKNPAGLPTAPGTVVKDFTPRLKSALTKIDTPKGPEEMNFNVIADIAGNIAGGIGKDQTKFPIGAAPSPFNDLRDAKIEASLSRNVDGSLTVAPAIKFKVQDTLDLCPGDCGAAREQIATIPLSRFEATGIVGDVPMIIEFDAPAAEQAPFVIPAPPKKPVTGKVTASSLNIRSAPNTSARIVGHYTRGTHITALCQTSGAVVDGNNTWFKTNKGFVSARFVSLSSLASPPSC